MQFEVFIFFHSKPESLKVTSLESLKCDLDDKKAHSFYQIIKISLFVAIYSLKCDL